MTQSSLTPDKIFDFPSTAYTLGAGIAAPLFDGGRRRAEREGAKAAVDIALATYKETVLRAFGQVADSLQALTNDDDTIKADHRALTLALSNLKLARTAYDAGGSGLLPLVDAQRTANDARRTLTEARTKRALDTVQLIVASGARWKVEG